MDTFIKDRNRYLFGLSDPQTLDSYRLETQSGLRVNEALSPALCLRRRAARGRPSGERTCRRVPPQAGSASGYVWQRTSGYEPLDTEVDDMMLVSFIVTMWTKPLKLCYN